MVWNHSCRDSWCRVCAHTGPVRCCSFLEGHVYNLSSKSAWSARFKNKNKNKKTFNEIKTFLWKTTVSRDIHHSQSFYSFSSPLLWDVSKSSPAFTEVTVSVAHCSLWGSTSSLMLQRDPHREMEIHCFSLFSTWLFPWRTSSTKLLLPQKISHWHPNQNIIITVFLTHGSKKDIEVITFITSAGDFWHLYVSFQHIWVLWNSHLQLNLYSVIVCNRGSGLSSVWHFVLNRLALVCAGSPHYMTPSDPGFIFQRSMLKGSFFFPFLPHLV